MTITKEQKLEALFLFKGQVKRLLIGKAAPWQLLQMESRLNRRLNTIYNKMINELLKDEAYTGKALEGPVRSAYTTMVPSTWRATSIEVSRLPSIDISSSIKPPSKWAELVEDRAFKASDRTIERMNGDVLQKMKEHVTDGKSQQKTVKELRNELKDMKRFELERITRTETHSLYMEAKQDLFNTVDSIVAKRWKITGENTRPWHEEADGQVVAYDEPFLVNDEELMFPGDMAGSAENVINCYCSMEPVTDSKLIE